MNKIIDVEDILAGARHCVECVFMAAASLSSREETDPLQAVADIASRKIDEAIALLTEYRASADATGISQKLIAFKAHMAVLAAWEDEQRAAGYTDIEIAGALREELRKLKAPARKPA